MVTLDIVVSHIVSSSVGARSVIYRDSGDVNFRDEAVKLFLVKRRQSGLDCEAVYVVVDEERELLFDKTIGFGCKFAQVGDTLHLVAEVNAEVGIFL